MSDRAAVPVDTSASAAARVRPVGLEAVQMGDGFWAQRMASNAQRGIPNLLARLEAHGVVDNFRPGPARRGLWFTDSDLYKWLEGAAWSLAGVADAGLEARVDEVVDVVCGASGDDGYLDTAFADPAQRFAQLGWSHELYCLGHLIQAAVARQRTVGDERLLVVARRFADLADRVLGPASGSADTDLHPGVETALVELARATGEERYLALAAALVDRVDLGAPVELRGHAVRAAYFATGVADLALEGDDARRETLDALWTSMVGERSYVTGGIGGRWIGESVGRAYELPAEGAYAETCGGVAVVHWAWRMLLLTGDARYADRLELALHNAFLAGVSLAGDEWFYANPLAASGEDDHDPWDNDRLAIDMAGPLPLRRRPWRDVTCCPPNANRMLASVPAYCYGESDEGLWMHLYASSAVTAGGLRATVHTDYPRDGRIEIDVEPTVAVGARAVMLRVPGWCEAATISVDGRPFVGSVRPGSYVRVGGLGASSRIVLEIDMAPTLVEASPRLAEARGSVAITRGPLVYCCESIDNPGVDVLAAAIDVEAPLAATPRPDLLGGVVTIATTGSVPDAAGLLYRPVGTGTSGQSAVAVPLVAIPYYAWANRGPSSMAVWLRR